MKKRFALIFLLSLPIGVLASTIDWTQPALMTDGTPVSPDRMATVETHLYADGQEFAIALDGKNIWTGTLPQAEGTTKTYTARAELDYLLSPESAPLLYTLVRPPPPPVVGVAKMRIRTNPELYYMCGQTTEPLTFGTGAWKIQKYKTRPEIWIELTQ